MELDRSYIRPGIYSIGLHVLILLLLLWHFEHNNKLDILKPQQRIVASVQVQSSDLKKIDKEIAEQKKTKPKIEETPKPTAPPEKAIAIEKPPEKLKPTPLPKPKPTPKPKSKKSDIDDLLKEANKEAVAKPKAKPAPPTDQAPNAPDDPTSGALDGDEDVAKIKSKIESNWSQPASYRPSMQALLLVDLLPTGEVSNVQIKESSGDSGFDNSAEVAVRKSSPLPVPQDPQRFEKYFRKFNFLFCPDCRDNTY